MNFIVEEMVFFPYDWKAGHIEVKGKIMSVGLRGNN